MKKMLTVRLDNFKVWAFMVGPLILGFFGSLIVNLVMMWKESILKDSPSVQAD